MAWVKPVTTESSEEHNTSDNSVTESSHLAGNIPGGADFNTVSAATDGVIEPVEIAKESVDVVMESVELQEDAIETENLTTEVSILIELVALFRLSIRK